MSHPYSALPPRAFWSRSIAKQALAGVDPVVTAKLKITRSDRVVTAGSCFAQHISKRLRSSGYTYHETELPHPLLPEGKDEDFGYGMFSARYGNIYTARQLLQLFQRAYGTFTPSDEVWTKGERYVDPFRPRIPVAGLSSPREVLASRDHHLGCVRRAFAEADVFVFTLGLTECWRASSDGSVFPLCPGVAGGQYDPGRYEFKNLTLDETVSDLEDFIRLLQGVNPACRLLLTVSPVALAATYSSNHVLVATTYSKSVLRVAAEIVAFRFDHVAYFPSYEIILGQHARGQFLAEDCRSVTDAGVSRVMDLLMSHYGDASEKMDSVAARSGGADTRARMREVLRRSEAAAKAVCDEEELAR